MSEKPKILVTVTAEVLTANTTTHHYYYINKLNIENNSYEVEIFSKEINDENYILIGNSSYKRSKKGNGSAKYYLQYTAADTSPEGQIIIIDSEINLTSSTITGTEFADSIIGSSKADLIISGAIEEYNEELKASILYDKILTEKIISEGAALFVLSRQENSNSYCKITKFSSASLEKYPYLYKVEKNSTTEIISATLIDASQNKLPEVVLTQQNQSYFDEIEMAALKKVFAENVNYFNAKSIFGETFNCSYSLNIAMAAAFIKVGRYKSALATGLDVHGNYLTALLEA